MELTKEKIDNLKLRLFLKYPFWTTIILSQNVLIRDAFQFPAATDGYKTIWLNPKKIESPDMLSHVFLHEILHIVLEHMPRRKKRKPYLWNVASDIIVELYLDEMQECFLPSMEQAEYWADLMKHKGDLSVEELYKLLLEESNRDVSDYIPTDYYVYGGFSFKKKPMEENSGLGTDCHLPFPGEKEKDDKKTNAAIDEIREKVIQGFTFDQFKNRGTVPDFYRRYVQKFWESKVPWRRVLMRYVETIFVRDDYSLTPPNKRYLTLSDDFWLPVLREEQEKIRNIVIAVDTSGSITKEILMQFALEMEKLYKISENAYIITCDCEIHQFIPMKKIKKFLKMMNFEGGGGTSHIPVFEFIREKKIVPDVFIGLTDLYSEFPERKPRFPVIWCVPEENHADAPWGNLVEIPI